MKKVSGTTLWDLLEDRSWKDVRDPRSMMHFLDIFERVCQTVAYAHSKDIIHRDLKPQNIMVDDYGAVFVMDWGIAKRLSADQSWFDSERTQAGDLLGSPAYMSPEQARRRAHTATYSADVFSLGVILYEILTGKRPFRGDSLEEMSDDIVYHTPKSPKSTNPHVGRELSAICMKALNKDPRNRYPSAKELATDIRCFREFRAVSAAPPRLIDHLRHWISRRPALASGIGAVVFVAALVSTAYAYHQYEENQFVEMAFSKLEEARNEVGEFDRAIADLQIKSLVRQYATQMLVLSQKLARIISARLIATFENRNTFRQRFSLPKYWRTR